MIIKYPDNTNDANIYADDRTSSYYSSKSTRLAAKYSKSDDIFSNLFVKYLATGSKFLDIGCGSGRDLANLNRYGFSVTGADSSEEMISAAISKYPELSGKIILTGLPNLPGLDNIFNGILCSAVLQHIPDSSLYESLRGIREILEDGGIFILSFPVDYPGIDPETNRDNKWKAFLYSPGREIQVFN